MATNQLTDPTTQFNTVAYHQVDGAYRLAIFSVKPIQPHEELTWDYNFAVRHTHAFAHPPTHPPICRLILSLLSPPPPQSFGEPKPCLCGAPNCRKVLAGKPLREDTPQPQLTAKGQQTQREARAAERFRRRVVLAKPRRDMGDLVLFFNGRTSRAEMARVGGWVFVGFLGGVVVGDGKGVCLIDPYGCAYTHSYLE